MEFISGEKFIKLSDFIYNIRVPGMDDYYNLTNTYNKVEIEKFNGIPIIYTHTNLVKILFPLIEKLNKEIILITHNSDNQIREKEIEKFERCKNIKYWFANNCILKNERIIAAKRRYIIKFEETCLTKTFQADTLRRLLISLGPN